MNVTSHDCVLQQQLSLDITTDETRTRNAVANLVTMEETLKPSTYTMQPEAEMVTQEATLTESWSTTVITSRSLQDHEVIASLRNQQHKIRVSDAVLPGSIIFPLCGIAFLLETTEEVLGSEREVVFDRIQQFTSIHRNSFLLIVAALHGPEEWDLMLSIQDRFLGSNLKIIPTHNSVEMVKRILTIAKATSKLHIETIRDRLIQAKDYIVANSPVWKILDEI
ncbi:protein SPO16 homolog [Leptodactylus fuscus]|uniref:protein SPO16 homolog n=1 Tax=Leptodactylus fuscus TaxID=238119 RepID=UPI003F4ECC48